MGRDLLMGAWHLIAAGKSRTNLTYFAHDFRSDLLIQNELALKCTSLGAAKNFLRFSVPAEASKSQVSESASRQVTGQPVASSQ
jgi:hypothetical protein